MAAASGAAAAYGSLPFDGIVDAKPGTSHFGVDHPVLRFDHDDNEQFDLLASHQRQQQRQLGSFSLPSRLEALLAGAQDRWLSVRPDRRALLARACVALTALVLLIAVISVSVSVSKSRRASRRAEAEALAGRTELCGWSSLYLPTVVTPSLYRLALQINLDRPSAVAPQLYGLHDGAPPPAQAFYVYGHLDTTVRAARPTACVVLHAAELNLRAVYLTLPGAPAVEGAVLRRNETSQQVVVKFDELLPADEVRGRTRTRRQTEKSREGTHQSDEAVTADDDDDDDYAQSFTTKNHARLSTARAA